jgi:hypothetical protein
MERSSQHLFLLFVLLVFYALGPLLILLWTLTSINYVSGRIENDALLGIVTTLATTPGAYTGVLQQMIVPVVAAVTAASFQSILSHRLARWLFIIPLVTIFICLSDALVFSSLMTKEDSGATIGGVSASGALSQFFLSTASTLATYVMLLVGLQAAVGASTGTVTDTGTIETYPETEQEDERGSLAWSQQAENPGEQKYPGAG